jgi:predicted Zn-dependent peptidase
MTDIIRTQNSMVYSVWTHAYGKKSNYASISAFRTNNPIKVVDLIHRSIDIAASGKCLSPFTAEGTGNDYVPIAEGLPFYKTSFATGFYSGLQNNTSIAKKMADSYMLTNDYTNYLKVMHRIRAVSAEDVQQAIAVYIQNANINWAISAHPETIEMIQKDYASYAPTYRRIDLE